MLEVLADRVVARRDQLRSGCREAGKDRMPTNECPPPLPSWPPLLSMTQRRSPSKAIKRCTLFYFYHFPLLPIHMLHHLTNHSTFPRFPTHMYPYPHKQTSFIVSSGYHSVLANIKFLCSSQLLIVQFSNITLLHSNYVKLFAFNIIQQTWFVISKTKFPTLENAIISIPS